VRRDAVHYTEIRRTPRRTPRAGGGAVGILAAVIAVAVVVATAATVGGAEWGTIIPGTSTMNGVRQQFGEPTRTEQSKTEGFDTEDWFYEGERAPAGMVRMIVAFGLATPSGYRREIVRTFLLQPKPNVLDRRRIVIGWGLPDRTGRDAEGEVFFYQAGLVVYFDKDGANPRSLVFTPPQPTAPAPAAPTETPAPAAPLSGER